MSPKTRTLRLGLSNLGNPPTDPTSETRREFKETFCDIYLVADPEEKSNLIHVLKVVNVFLKTARSKLAPRQSWKVLKCILLIVQALYRTFMVQNQKQVQ